MTTAAVYCRVSTDNQEREGTSLQTQLENCLTYCKNKGYEVSYRFSEAYSGLSLVRPDLDKARELVRGQQIDVLVVYALDRLSRDPGHGVIITQELEKHGVKLEAVTEDINTSELGKLISYIRGFASKLEAEKIKERTMRGKAAGVKAGHIVTGSGRGLYGYDYLKRVKGERQAERVINDTEAAWVKQIFNWLVNDGLSSNEITYRLRASDAPTKAGKIWGRSSVLRILKNKAYAGRSNATPAILSQELFDTAQTQLVKNSVNSKRNVKHEYLLRGHIRCQNCGKTYAGEPHRGKYYYRCLGRRRINLTTELCRNKVWPAEKLETLVWTRLCQYFGDKTVIRENLENQRGAASQLETYQTELQRIERQYKAAEREQHQLLQWALKDFPAAQVESENKRINKAKETLTAQKIELEKLIQASQNALINVPNLERFIQDMQDKLHTLDFEGKRLALEWLGITVWLDGENIEVTGIIETKKDVCIETTTSSGRGHNTTIPFSLKIRAGVV